MPKNVLISPQESILYFYVKQHGLTSQKDLIAFRGKDDRTTRKLLQSLVSKGVLKVKAIHNKGEFGGARNYYNLKH